MLLHFTALLCSTLLRSAPTFSGKHVARPILLASTLCTIGMNLTEIFSFALACRVFWTVHQAQLPAAFSSERAQYMTALICINQELQPVWCQTQMMSHHA